MSNKLETYIENFCRNNLLVAVHWSEEMENALIAYIGMETK